MHDIDEVIVPETFASLPELIRHYENNTDAMSKHDMLHFKNWYYYAGNSKQMKNNSILAANKRATKTTQDNLQPTFTTASRIMVSTEYSTENNNSNFALRGQNI